MKNSWTTVNPLLCLTLGQDSTYIARKLPARGARVPVTNSFRHTQDFSYDKSLEAPVLTFNCSNWRERKKKVTLSSPPDGQMGRRVFSIWANPSHCIPEFLLEHSQASAPALLPGPGAMSVDISGHQNQGKRRVLLASGLEGPKMLIHNTELFSPNVRALCWDSMV